MGLRRHPSGTAVLGIAIAVGACGRGEKATTTTTTTATATATATTTATATATATTTATTTATARRAARGLRCKAIGATRPVHLLRHNQRLVDMAIDEAGITWLGRRGWQGKYAIHRFARDGSDLRELARFASEETTRILAENGAIYFSSRTGGYLAGNDTLYRVPQEGGPMEIVAERFGALGGVFEGHAYGINYDLRRGVETVTRVPIAGGEPRELLRRKVGYVGYGGCTMRFADLAVDKRGVYLADWGTGKILRMPHEGGPTVDLVTNVFIPEHLRVLGDRLYFNGIDRSVPTEGGRVTGTTGPWVNPWAVAHDGDRFIALGMGSQGRRMGVLDASGTWSRLTPIEHIYQRAAVADEDCVYYVRVDPSGESYFSAIPAPPRGG